MLINDLVKIFPRLLLGECHHVKVVPCHKHKVVVVLRDLLELLLDLLKAVFAPPEVSLLVLFVDAVLVQLGRHADNHELHVFACRELADLLYPIGEHRLGNRDHRFLDLPDLLPVKERRNRGIRLAKPDAVGKDPLPLGHKPADRAVVVLIEVEPVRDLVDFQGGVAELLRDVVVEHTIVRVFKLVTFRVRLNPACKPLLELRNRLLAGLVLYAVGEAEVVHRSDQVVQEILLVRLVPLRPVVGVPHVLFLIVGEALPALFLHELVDDFGRNPFRRELYGRVLHRPELGFLLQLLLLPFQLRNLGVLVGVVPRLQRRDPGVPCVQLVIHCPGK